jgi:transposase
MHGLMLTQRQRLSVPKLYRDGLSTREVAHRFGVSHNTILNILTDADAGRRTIAESRRLQAKLTTERRNEAIRLYRAGLSASEIARRFGVTATAILQVLRASDVARRPHSEANRRYACDHTFFDCIDAEPKAYWLGFLAADGCIDKRVGCSGRILLTLARADKEHVKRFKKAIRASNPIRYHRHGSGHLLSSRQSN